MVEIAIPAPDAAGYFHFTYITTDRLDGRWYGGKRSTKKHPTADRYLGSGNWIKAHPARERLHREVVAFFPTSAAVFAAEAQLVTWAVVNGDPLCMNLRDGGEGTSVEQAARVRSADPEWSAKMSAAGRLSAEFRRNAPAEWHEKRLATMRLVYADPAWLEKNATANRSRARDRGWLDKMIASGRRLSKDPAWIAANQASFARMWADPEYRRKHAAAARRNGDNPEICAKKSARLRDLWADPEYRDRMTAAFRLRGAAKRAASA